MVRWPLETTRFIVEGTSYLTIGYIYRYIDSATVRGPYFTKNFSSFFLKLENLDKEVIVTGTEFQILGPW